MTALRGLVIAYAAMGVAGAAALAYITLIVFPDGYVKSGERLWSSFGSLAVASLISGTAGLWIGLRCSLPVAALGAFAALMSLPLGLPLILAALYAFAVIQFVLRALFGD